MASVGGHKGGLYLMELLDILERHGFQQRHVAFNERGAKIGLPPDVATLMTGRPNEGFWWNLKKGTIPEYTIRNAAVVEDDEEILEDLNRLGWIGSSVRPGALSMFNPDNMKKYHRPTIKYIGWREVVTHLLKFRRIRESDEIEELLGSRDYISILKSRKRWEQAMAVDITAD